MKIYILALGVASVFFSCGDKEIARLKSSNDSLTYVLVESRKTEVALNEVGVLLDSIDASRHVLRADIVEGISYADYISRLKEINTHIKTSQAKLTALETELGKAKSGNSAAIRRLKTDLEARSKEIVELQLTVVELRDKNNALIASELKKDSLISAKDEVIKLRTADVASLEGLMEDINTANKDKVGNLYYAQAAALEEAAKRTKFAPRKKKETKREALELYRLAYSLGNEGALIRIQALEKDLA